MGEATPVLAHKRKPAFGRKGSFGFTVLKNRQTGF